MVSVSRPSHLLHSFRSNSSPKFAPSLLCFSVYVDTHSLPRLCALRTGSEGGKIGSREAYDADLLRKPVVSKEFAGILDEDEDIEVRSNLREEEEEDAGEEDEDEKIDWEDKILEETVPLVGFVRMLLHSGRYQSGDRFRPDHERTVLEKLLPHHPECEKKIGCGIDYITVGYHPDFESSRCLFIVRTDGVRIDFSYWKCIKGLIRKKYPLYADVFILRHFRRRHRSIGRL